MIRHYKHILLSIQPITRERQSHPPGRKICGGRDPCAGGGRHRGLWHLYRQYAGRGGITREKAALGLPLHNTCILPSGTYAGGAISSVCHRRPNQSRPGWGRGILSPPHLLKSPSRYCKMRRIKTARAKVPLYPAAPPAGTVAFLLRVFRGREKGLTSRSKKGTLKQSMNE